MAELRKTGPVSWLKAALRDFERFPAGAQSICLVALTAASRCSASGRGSSKLHETEGEDWASSALGLQFLIGQADGSFVATNEWFPLNKRRMPEMAMELGKAGGDALVEFNDFTGRRPR